MVAGASGAIHQPLGPSGGVGGSGEKSKHNKEEEKRGISRGPKKKQGDGEEKPSAGRRLPRENFLEVIKGKVGTSNPLVLGYRRERKLRVDAKKKKKKQ